MDDIEKKQPVSKATRDSLLFRLHSINHHTHEELSEMFKLSKNYVITIIKQQTTVNKSANLCRIQDHYQETQNNQIESVIMEEIDSKVGAITTTSLYKTIDKKLGLQINKAALQRCLKQKLGLQWKKMTHNDAYVNTNQNIALRRHFAIQLIQQIKQQKIILNFDESVIQFSDNSNFTWERKYETAQRLVGKKVQGLSLLAAISSIGEVFFQYIDGYNNEVSVASFIVKLEESLSKVNPTWKQTHILLMDNCPSHKTSLVRKVLSTLEITTIFSAPASYKAMPIELLFGAMKRKKYLVSTTPALAVHESIKNKNLSNKQKLMLEIGEYLKSIDILKIKSIFLKQLLHLEDFLKEKKV